MVPGVLFLVPSGIAAAGGLAMTEQASGEKYSQGLVIGFRMVQVAIGITVSRAHSSCRSTLFADSLNRSDSSDPVYSSTLSEERRVLLCSRSSLPAQTDPRLSIQTRPCSTRSYSPLPVLVYTRYQA